MTSLASLKRSGLSLLSLVASSILAFPGAAAAGNFSSNWNSGLEAGAALVGQATAVGAKIVLTDNTGADYGRVVLDDLDPGQAVDSFLGCTTVFIGNGTAADGFSFNFGDKGSISSDAEGVQTGLAVSLDTYDNGSGDVSGQISVTYDGSVVVNGTPKNLRTGSFVSLCVLVRATGEIKVWHDGEGIVGNIAGWSAVAGRQFILAASTGGLADEHTIEDTHIVTHPVGAYNEDFETGTATPGWSFFGSGRHDDFYARLTDNAGSQQGSAILEDQDPGVAIDSFGLFFAKYIWNGGSADGMSLRFGPLPDASFGEGAETNGLVISWPTYNNDTLRAFYDQVLVAESSERQLRGQWSYVQVSVEPDGRLLVADTADNTATALIDVTIPGWAPQAGWRFGVGARTGGFTDDHAITQFSLQTGVCGNGVIDVSEQCDDGGTADSDGCSAACQVESGWDCSSGSCSTVCGDSIVAGTENCDDGGTSGGDCCSATCSFEAAASPCGDAGDACTLADTCDGAGTCVDNGFQPVDTACGDAGDDECTNPDTCDGAGTCLANHEASGTSCGDTGTECVVQDTCDTSGNCVDNGFQPAATACGDSTDGECSDPDTCDGAGSCLSNHESPGTSCGDAGTACVVQDTCDAAGNCVDNGFQPTDTACGDASDGECSDPDTCDGAGACLSNHEDAGTACGDATDSECSEPDTCDGAGSCLDNHAAADTSCGDAGTECIAQDTCDGAGACSDNGFMAGGTACGDSTDDSCTAPDTCDGAGTCDANHEADGTSCRGPANSCDAEETCVAGACPADENLADGTSCDDANPLTEGETCDIGVCACAPGACDFNCGDGTQDADEECDDGANVDGDGCSATCELEAGCGNSALDAGETCDDGGTVDGDGCSSRCQEEAAQSKDQQRCINITNNLATKLALTQGKENLLCLKNGGRGKLPEGQSITECLSADAKGKLAKVASKIKTAQEGDPANPSKTKCPETPDFGFEDDEVIAAGVPGVAISFFEDVIGDADTAAIDLVADPEQKKAAVCQQSLVKGADKIFLTQMKEFVVCKKRLLKDAENPAVSTVGLESCAAAFVTDENGKIEKERLKLDGFFEKKCAAHSVALADALAGECAQSAADIPAFSACLVERARCRTCQVFNIADDLVVDCDVLDDGLDNDTCPDPGGAGSPAGAFVDGPVTTIF